MPNASQASAAGWLEPRVSPFLGYTFTSHFLCTGEGYGCDCPSDDDSPPSSPGQKRKGPGPKGGKGGGKSGGKGGKPKGGKGGSKKRVARWADPIRLPSFSLFPLAPVQTSTQSDPQSTPDRNDEQGPTDNPGTAVAHVPSGAQLSRRGRVLPLIAVGGGLGGAAAGKVLIEGIGWVSRKAAMKIGPMIGKLHPCSRAPDS